MAARFALDPTLLYETRQEAVRDELRAQLGAGGVARAQRQRLTSEAGVPSSHDDRWPRGEMPCASSELIQPIGSQRS